VDYVRTWFRESLEGLLGNPVQLLTPGLGVII